MGFLFFTLLCFSIDAYVELLFLLKNITDLIKFRKYESKLNKKLLDFFLVFVDKQKPKYFFPICYC